MASRYSQVRWARRSCGTPRAVYKLSPKAAADLEGIYVYTILHFGLEQARII
jgi:hypothetical protein